MNERPFNKQLEARTDETFSGYIEVPTQGQPEGWDGYTDFEFLAADSLSASAPAFVGSCTAEPGRLNLSVDEATLKENLPADSAAAYKTLEYVVRARPPGTYRIVLGFGKFKLTKGLPEVPQ